MSILLINYRGIYIKVGSALAYHNTGLVFEYYSCLIIWCLDLFDKILQRLQCRLEDVDDKILKS